MTAEKGSRHPIRFSANIIRHQMRAPPLKEHSLIDQLVHFCHLCSFLRKKVKYSLLDIVTVMRINLASAVVVGL